MDKNNQNINQNEEIYIGTKENSVEKNKNMANIGQESEKEIEINGDNDKKLSADVNGDETKENEENKTQEDEEKNEEKNKEKNEEKNEDPKVVNTPWGFLLTQLFGTFGPVLGALSGPVGLLLIVYVLPKTTKLKLPNIKLNNGSKDALDKDATTVNLNNDLNNNNNNLSENTIANKYALGQGTLTKQETVNIGGNVLEQSQNQIKEAFKSNEMQEAINQGSDELKNAYNTLKDNTDDTQSPVLLTNFLTELVKLENIKILPDINKAFENKGFGDLMKGTNEAIKDVIIETFKNENLENLIYNKVADNLFEEENKLMDAYNNLINPQNSDKFFENLTQFNNALNEVDKDGIIKVQINELMKKKFEGKGQEFINRLKFENQKTQISSSQIQGSNTVNALIDAKISKPGQLNQNTNLPKNTNTKDSLALLKNSPY